jgi:asparagine synthase (glutamine-hydrolysing)
MCGIAGVVYADCAQPPDRTTMKAMGDALAHRGPDAEGFFAEPGVALVHRRLSIIDLASGNQPMANEDGTVQVVFNGEIYNFQAIRAWLEAKGHSFRTRSDTEVLVHLYEEEGEQLVLRLRGMFAFAIWDRPRRRLMLARDRIGLKPLYIYLDAEKLIFASELKAILAHPRVDRSLDVTALDDYLALGMIPGERTIFRCARKLLPAHTLTISGGRLDAPARRYWQFRVQNDLNRNIDEWCEHLQAKLVETVAAHQIADVPVGAFLSGGIDSSVMVAVQSQLSKDPVNTFSIGFQEARYSELPYARQVGQQFSTRHAEQVVTPEATRLLDDLVHYFDEPFADPSALPTLCVSRLARESVKVVISGDGGDEALGGYSRYTHDLREACLRRHLPLWLRRNVIGRLARHWPKADWLPRMFRAKTTLTNLSLEPAAAYANTLVMCRPSTRRLLLSADIAKEIDGSRVEGMIQEQYAAAPSDDPLAGMITVDVNLLLPDDFLTKVDRASMSCGLEVRPPFVDHEFLELCGQIPSELKIRHGRTKWLLRKLFAERLPPGIVSRAKHGFDLPVDAWLRGPLREVFESAVLAPHCRLANLVDQVAIRRIYRAHLSKRGSHGSVLWSLLVLARWTDAYVSPL